MAYTTVPVSAYQGSNYYENWTKYRTMKGAVEMRLTDVSLPSGARWMNPVSLEVALFDQAGNKHGQATIYKRWGEPTSFVRIGTATGPNGKSLRLRTLMRCYVALPQGGDEAVAATWTSELRWSNVAIV